ncbi:TetR/AcrR family transcriptional regulator [Gordonia hankookensis]|uniref:TetR/AcrR family transcriptional regulator n=1 Tax=Gordonia hankookensis TaxID=589403 RepID=A0ABR7W9G4_9ACTN|nr:TetR/AcrR family transcriptional regulator [Gordonia hankookensis]MBD1319446.1 TetR/AcrR family transcriptional regulator [Gordonia hankookensis]
MSDGSGVARRIAARSVAKRESGYADEIRRLIDAGRTVMAGSGHASVPRVADIVAAAGLSNDAFYRHFRSKDDLIAAILEDGTDRLCSYLDHQMGKEGTARGRVVRWVEGVLSQAQDDSAQTTRAVLWNVGSVNQEVMSSPPSVNARLAELLHEPLGELGSGDPVFDARLISNATVGALSDYLWRKVSPTAHDISRIVSACFRLLG